MFLRIPDQKRMTPLSFSITYPRGRYIIRVSKHVAAVVDGVIRDDYPINPARFVYGAWKVHI